MRHSRVVCMLNSALCVTALFSILACSRPADTANEPPLVPVLLPELSAVDPPVQAQIRDKHAAVSRLVDADTSAADLAQGFGELGMLLHAAEYYDAAEPAYANARRLGPEDPRWPYYLAHLHRSRGALDRAVTELTRVLELRPQDVASLIWLGRTYLDLGDATRAATAFERAASAAPQAVAARVGLGQTALMGGDPARAVQEFERALSLDSSIASVYAPLATAYRALGQADKADDLQSHWRNTDVPVPDPLRMELETTLKSGPSYELLGVRTMAGGEYGEAARLFREGLALSTPGSPLHRSLRHKLGTALALGGNAAAAVEEFEATLRDAPPTGQDEPSAKASYSLGLLHADAGRLDVAIARLTDAVRYDPNYLEAYLALADLLRSAGRAGAARRHYEAALRLDPRSSRAHDGLAALGGG